MKRAGLICLAALLLACCAQNSGRTGTTTDSYRGSGASPGYARTNVNDLDDLGYNTIPYSNQKPNGQPRFPDRSIDVDTR